MRKAIRGVAFFIVTILLLYRTYDILRWKDTLGGYLSSTNQMYSTDDGLMDVVFMGSSHCFSSVYPEVLWGEFGFAGFDMSISGQDKQSTYYYLKEVLKTQSPKVVCVELWGLIFDTHGVQGNVYRNMLSMDLSKNAVDLVKAYVEEDEQEDYLLRWPIIHTRYKELDRYDFRTMDLSEYGRGNVISHNVGYAHYPTEVAVCEEIGVLTESNRKWLESLYELSVEEDFHLVFFLAPTALSVEHQMQVNATEEFAKEKGITFFDFNRLKDEVGLDYSRDFSDTTHLNAYGAEKVTNYFGMYFSENCDIEDHRGEEAYYQWEQAYTYFDHVTQTKKLKESPTLEEYIARLKKMDDITYVFSFEGTYKDSTLNMRMAAKSLGLTKEQYEIGGTAICIDGELEYIMDNQSKEVAIFEMNEYDSFKIQNMMLQDPGVTNLDDIMFNLEPLGEVGVYNGLNFYVYDNVQKKIIDKRGYY